MLRGAGGSKHLMQNERFKRDVSFHLSVHPVNKHPSLRGFEDKDMLAYANGTGVAAKTVWCKNTFEQVS